MFPTQTVQPSLSLTHSLLQSYSLIHIQKNVIVAVNGVPSPPTPRDLRRQIRQLQAKIRHLLPNLHRPPPHRFLPFPPLPNLPNPNLFPPSLHLLRRRLRRPLHRSPNRHLRLRLPPCPHAHAPQGGQGLRHLQVHRGRFRQRPNLPHYRGPRHQRHLRSRNRRAVTRRGVERPRRRGVDRSGARGEGESGGEWDSVACDYQVDGDGEDFEGEREIGGGDGDRGDEVSG